MVVTLPFVMLLLDYWPLRRFEPVNISAGQALLTRLICEKIPFFLLAVVASALTFFFQHQDAATASLRDFPISARISNALVAYACYLEETFWPIDLANPYPLTWHWPWGEVLAAGVLVIGLSVLAILMGRKWPCGLVGWLWFLGTMLPVIGLVQVGVQSMADRYTYIPLLGVFWIIVWGADDFTARWRLRGRVVTFATLLILGICAMRTRAQLDYWRDGESLFRHAITLTKNNFVAFDGLGRALYNKGQTDEAVSYYLKSLEIRPRYREALNHLADALARLDIINANTNNRHGLARLIGTDYANAHNTLGLGLALNGNLNDAISHFRKALLYEPDNVNVRCNLAYALVLQGRLNEATWQCRQVLQRSPLYPIANNILGLALLKQGRWNEAAAHLREALQYEPDFADAHYNLGQALAALGQRDEAIAHFKEALQLNPNEPGAREKLNQLENSAR